MVYLVWPARGNGPVEQTTNGYGVNGTSAGGGAGVRCTSTPRGIAGIAVKTFDPATAAAAFEEAAGSSDRNKDPQNLEA